MAAARDNLATGVIATVGILLVILVFALVLLVQGWFYKAQTDEYVRKVIEPRSDELAPRLTVRGAWCRKPRRTARP